MTIVIFAFSYATPPRTRPLSHKGMVSASCIKNCAQSVDFRKQVIGEEKTLGRRYKKRLRHDP